MSETPTKSKRKVDDTDFTSEKMEFKIDKKMEDNDAEDVINDTDLDYLSSAGKFIPKLLSASDLQLVKTVPKEVVKDKDMNLTNEEGTKTSFKDALYTLKNSEEIITQPSHTPVIKPVEHETIDQDKESVKSLSEIFDKWMKKDGKFKEQVVKANKVNSSRISTNEAAMLRKHVNDENYRLYVTKINVNGIVSRKWLGACPSRCHIFNNHPT